MRSEKFVLIFVIFGIFFVLPSVFILNFSNVGNITDFGITPIINIAIILLPILLLLLFFSKGLKVIWRNFVGDKDILKKGIDGKGEILSIATSKTQLNYQPVMDIKLEISSPMYPAYIVEDGFVIPFNAIHLMQVGAILPVKIDPKNTKNVAFNFK